MQARLKSLRIPAEKKSRRTSISVPPGTEASTSIFSPKILRRLNNFVLSILLIFVILIYSGDDKLLLGQVELNKKIEISEIDIGRLEFREFQISEPTTIRISGTAVGDTRSGDMFAYGWILDASQREIVWKMNVNNVVGVKRTRVRNPGADILRYDSMFELPQGDFELYYFAMEPLHYRRHVQGFSRSQIRRLMERLIQRENLRLPVGDLDITIQGDKRILAENRDNLNSLKKQAILSLSQAENNVYLKQGFEILEDLNVRIYSIGEFASFGNTGNDFGWIIDKNSREKVWEMMRSRTDHAGGGEKNRKINEVMTLPKGEYIAYYVSDGSHSFNNWNVPPPYDPHFWGITIFGADTDFERSSISLFDERVSAAAIVSLVGLTDDQIVSRGFTLHSDTNLYISALGESDYSLQKMVDFGWVINADTRKIIWKMDVTNTYWGGGHAKNRIFNRLIPFISGNYIAYYITDDSHSFNNWNEAPPYDPDKWGISINAESINEGDIALFDAEKYTPTDIIAHISRARDNMRIKRSFALDDQTLIRIYALGEGQYGTMHDYGWIERAEDEEIVWEMTYGITKKAGGAVKNRLFDNSVLFDKGKYNLFYVTNDSHSFAGWNETPPLDPVSWGITIFKIKN